MSKKYRNEEIRSFERLETKEKKANAPQQMLIACLEGTLSNNDGSSGDKNTLTAVGQAFDDFRGLTVHVEDMKICVRASKPMKLQESVHALPHKIYVPGVGAPSTGVHPTPGLLTYYGKDKKQAEKDAGAKIRAAKKPEIGYDFFGVGPRFPKIEGITGTMQGAGLGKGREENALKIATLFLNQLDKYDIYSLSVSEEKHLPSLRELSAKYSEAVPLIIKHGEAVWVLWRDLFGNLQLSESTNPELYRRIDDKPQHSYALDDNLVASSSILKPVEPKDPEKVDLDNCGAIYADLAEIQGPAVQAYGEYSKIVLIGWSRGAVTAIHIANLLANSGFKGEIHLFLIDPVVGGDDGLTDEMTRTLPANVKATIILAKGEQRDKFEAQDLSRITPETGAEVTYIPVNGTHFQVADCLRSNSDSSSIPAEITRYHLEQFIVNAVGEEEARNILPEKRADFTHKELIRKYAATQVNIQDYEHNLDSQIIERRIFKKVRRNCLDNLEDYTHKPEIFVNAHHAKIFAGEYSDLYEKIISGTVSPQDLDIDAPDLDDRSKEIIISSTLLNNLNNQIDQIHRMIRKEENELKEFAKKSNDPDEKGGDEKPKPPASAMKIRAAANEALKSFKSSLLELKASAEQEIYAKLAEIRTTAEESGAIDGNMDDSELAKLAELPLVRQCDEAAEMSKIILSKGFEIVLMPIKPGQKISEILTEHKDSKEFRAKPILFKQGDQFFFWGGRWSKKGEWQIVSSLNADKFKELDFSDRPQILPGKLVPKAVYAEIALKQGHFPIKKNISITQKFRAVNQFSDRWQESWGETARRVVSSAAGYLRAICLAPVLLIPIIYCFLTSKLSNCVVKPAVKKIDKPAKAAENFLSAHRRLQSHAPPKSVRPVIRPR